MVSELLELPTRIRNFGLGARQSQVLRRSAQMTLGVGFAQMLQLIATPVILHLYGASAFGRFSILFSAATVLSVVATLRLDAIIPAAATRSGSLRLAGAALVLGFAAIPPCLLLIIFAAAFIQGAPTRAAAAELLLVPLLACSQSSGLALRAILIRFGVFDAAARSQIARSGVFVGISLALELLTVIVEFPASLALLLAQIAGDAASIFLCVRVLRPNQRRILSPLALRRNFSELRNNRKLVQATALGNTLNILTQALPLLTVGFAFGTQAAGWFSAAQRLVLAPTTFVLETTGTAFAQHLREKIAGKTPFGRDLIMFMIILWTVLGPPFLVLGLLAGGGALSWLGPDWSAIGPTLMAMIFVTLGTIPYVAAANLPTLLSLNRLFVIYHAARLTVGLMLAGLASGHLLTYFQWLWTYVAIESLSYAIFSLSCFLLSRRR